MLFWRFLDRAFQYRYCLLVYWCGNLQNGARSHVGPIRLPWTLITVAVEHKFPSMSHPQNSHVRQREATDCVIATVAAIANMPYEAVAELSPRKPGKHGLYPLEVWKLLQNATQLKWKYPRTVFTRLRKLCDSQYTLVLFIRQPGNALLQRIFRKTQHCIFVRRGMVFDPECNTAIHADNYDRLNWIPTIAFRARDNESLAKIQDDNFSKYREERLWSEMLSD